MLRHFHNCEPRTHWPLMNANKKGPRPSTSSDKFHLVIAPSQSTPPKDKNSACQRYCGVLLFVFKCPHTKEFSLEIQRAQTHQWWDHEWIQQGGVAPSSVDQMANKTKGAILSSKRLRSAKRNWLNVNNFYAHPSNKEKTSASQCGFRTFQICS